MRSATVLIAAAVLVLAAAGIAQAMPAGWAGGDKVLVFSEYAPEIFISPANGFLAGVGCKLGGGLTVGAEGQLAGGAALYGGFARWQNGQYALSGEMLMNPYGSVIKLTGLKSMDLGRAGVNLGAGAAVVNNPDGGLIGLTLPFAEAGLMMQAGKSLSAYADLDLFLYGWATFGIGATIGF